MSLALQGLELIAMLAVLCFAVTGIVAVTYLVVMFWAALIEDFQDWRAGRDV